MQIVESFSTIPAKHFLTDEIYAPSLSTETSDVTTKADVKAHQHTKAINELHRFLESSCDCV
jgi:hypothetical protein